MGIRAQTGFGVGKVHVAEQLQRTVASFDAVEPEVSARPPLGELLLDGEKRIETRRRVLEDEAHPRPV